MSIELIRLTPESEARYAPAIARLLDETFGARPDQPEMIARWVRDPERHVLVACDERGLCGVSVVRLGPHRPLETYATFTDDVPHHVGPGPVAEFQMLAVAPDRRRQGIGFALSSLHHQYLLDAGATGAMGVSWQHPLPSSSSHLFEAAGFEVIGHDPTYFRRMHADGGQRCPFCAPADCTCVAVLYARRWG